MVCQQYYKCERYVRAIRFDKTCLSILGLRCLKVVHRKVHKCGLQWCNICKLDCSISLPYGPRHLCFMAPILNDVKRDNLIHLLYDIGMSLYKPICFAMEYIF